MPLVRWTRSLQVLQNGQQEIALLEDTSMLGRKNRYSSIFAKELHGRGIGKSLHTRFEN
jgi:hypothetical protein